MTMLKYENGPRVTMQYKPGGNVLAGDVIVQGNLAFISDVDNPSGTGMPIRQGSVNVAGGIYSGIADGAIPVGSYVNWDSVAGKISLGGDIGLGWLVAGPTGVASDPGPLVNGDKCYIFHDPAAAGGAGELPTATVAALGTIQGDAAQLAPGFSLVNGADATKGVRLPLAAAGLVCEVKNSDAANAILKVWPGVGDGINALAVNGALSMAAKTSAIFRALDATTWITIPLVPS